MCVMMYVLLLSYELSSQQYKQAHEHLVLVRSEQSIPDCHHVDIC